MAAIDFPNAPTVGQIYAAATGVTYQWTGTLWAVYGTVPPSSGFVAAPTYDTRNDAVAGTLAIPMDDTIPQITEGNRLFQRTFTALDATHPIDVDVDTVLGSSATGVNFILALFIDNAPNAVAVKIVNMNVANAMSEIRLRWRDVLAAGAHIFEVRWGGAPTNIYMFRNDTSRYLGGSMQATMSITEIGIGIKGPTGDPGPVGGAAATPLMVLDNTRGTLAGIPADDTIPQITEGTRAWQRTFTAVNPANPIEVDADIDFGASGTAAHVGAALFIDGAPDAVTSRMGTCNVNWFDMVRLRWRGVLAAGPHTFEIRIGGVPNAGVYWNRTDSLFLGGTLQSCISITEIAIPAATGIQGPPGPAGPIGGYQTGDTITSYRTTPSSGWIIADDGTIGDATSGGTSRANADCIDLFNLFWPNANCLIAGGKGASAAADWAAHKALGLPKTLGRVLGVAGAAGAGGLTARGVGDAVGAESYNGNTGGSVGDAGINPQPGGWVFSQSGHYHSFTWGTMQPSAFLKLHIKL